MFWKGRRVFVPLSTFECHSGCGFFPKPDCYLTDIQKPNLTHSIVFVFIRFPSHTEWARHEVAGEQNKLKWHFCATLWKQNTQKHYRCKKRHWHCLPFASGNTSRPGAWQSIIPRYKCRQKRHKCFPYSEVFSHLRLQRRNELFTHFFNNSPPIPRSAWIFAELVLREKAQSSKTGFKRDGIHCLLWHRNEQSKMHFVYLRYFGKVWRLLSFLKWDIFLMFFLKFSYLWLLIRERFCFCTPQLKNIYIFCLSLCSVSCLRGRFCSFCLHFCIVKAKYYFWLKTILFFIVQAFQSTQKQNWFTACIDSACFPSLYIRVIFCSMNLCSVCTHHAIPPQAYTALLNTAMTNTATPAQFAQRGGTCLMKLLLVEREVFPHFVLCVTPRKVPSFVWDVRPPLVAPLQGDASKHITPEVENKLQKRFPSSQKRTAEPHNWKSLRKFQGNDGKNQSNCAGAEFHWLIDLLKPPFLFFLWSLCVSSSFEFLSANWGNFSLKTTADCSLRFVDCRIVPRFLTVIENETEREYNRLSTWLHQSLPTLQQPKLSQLSFIHPIVVHAVFLCHSLYLFFFCAFICHSFILFIHCHTPFPSVFLTLSLSLWIPFSFPDSLSLTLASFLHWPARKMSVSYPIIHKLSFCVSLSLLSLSPVLFFFLFPSPFHSFCPLSLSLSSLLSPSLSHFFFCFAFPLLVTSPITIKSLTDFTPTMLHLSRCMATAKCLVFVAK